jgi:hypothetical protein
MPRRRLSFAGPRKEVGSGQAMTCVHHQISQSHGGASATNKEKKDRLTAAVLPVILIWYLPLLKESIQESHLGYFLLFKTETRGNAS